MVRIKQLLPLWLKCPLAVFLNEFRKLPPRLVLCHMYRSIIENGSFSESVQKSTYKYVQKTTYWYFSEKYRKLLCNMAQDCTLGSKVVNPPIWVFWWQGESTAPDIVKRCIASIRENANGHPVYVIDQKNYKEYVDIPPSIIDKLTRKSISITHFSDIYRMGLLAKHSGIWIDASIFMQRPFPESAFASPIYSVRNPGKDVSNISNWDWTVGVIGGWKGNFLFQATYELLLSYWKDHDFLVDYFVFDYMIRLIVDNVDLIKESIESIPVNNQDFYYMQEMANMPFEKATLSDDILKSTWLFRMSWKGKYLMETPDGCKTLYASWLHRNSCFQ